MSKLTKDKSAVRTIRIVATKVPPGRYIAHKFGELIRFAQAKALNLSVWGICEYRDNYWVGNECFLENNDSLMLLSLLDVREQREKEYAEWGDDEIYVIAGRTLPDREFKWFLLSKPEMDENMQEVEFHRPEDLN